MTTQRLSRAESPVSFYPNDPDHVAAEPSDAELMRRAAGGDRRAFDEVFARHAGAVRGFLIRRMRSPEHAEEILQETFLQAWEQAGRYRERRCQVRGWLLVLARSRALDRLRSRSSRVQREVVSQDYLYPSLQVEPLGIRGLEGEERRQRVTRALATLPAAQRRCIELAYYEGLSQSQIASHLDKPLGTVKSRILLGMGKLRVALGSSRAA